MDRDQFDVYTTIGQRDENEDSYVIDEELGLYVVADGMGGHAAGATASRLAVEIVQAELRRQALDRRPGHPLTWPIVTRAVETVCRKIFEHGAQDPSKRGMGTTLTLLMLDHEHQHAIVAHVGDSRLYRVRGGEVELLTYDHSIAAELERSGLLEDPLPDESPYRHILTRSLGTHAGVIVDTLTMPVFGGETFVLVTDGAVRGTELLALPKLLAGDHPAKAIVDAAVGQGSRDNSTALVVHVAARGTAEDPRIEDLLRTVAPFSGVSEMGLLHLRNAGRRVRLRAGDVLFPAGREVARMVMVLSGELRWEGSRREPPALRAGDVAGLTTLSRPRLAPAALVAAEPSEVFVLTTTGLQRQARYRHGLGFAVYSGLAAALAAHLDGAATVAPTRLPF